MTPPELAAIRARDAALGSFLPLQTERDRRALLAEVDAMRGHVEVLCAAATPAFDTEYNRRALYAAIQRAREALEVK